MARYHATWTSFVQAYEIIDLVDHGIGLERLRWNWIGRNSLEEKCFISLPSVHFTIYLLVKKIMNGIHSLYVFLPAYACTCVHICVYAQAHITYKCYHVGQIRGGGRTDVTVIGKELWIVSKPAYQGSFYEHSFCNWGSIHYRWRQNIRCADINSRKSVTWSAVPHAPILVS